MVETPAEDERLVLGVEFDIVMTLCSSGLEIAPDILFMFDVQRAGFVAKVHGDVLCGHLPEFPFGSKSRRCT